MPKPLLRLAALTTLALVTALACRVLLTALLQPIALPTLAPTSTTAPPRAPALTPEQLARLTGLSQKEAQPTSSPVQARTVEGLRLRGTLRSARRGLSLATIEQDGATRWKTVSEGDALAGYAIREIGHGYLLLERDGETSRLDATPPTQSPAILTSSVPAPVSGPLPSLQRGPDGQFEVKRAEVLGLTGSIDTLSRDGLFLPRYEGGALSGFSLSRSRSGGLFDRLGLQQGDLVRSLNGTPLTSFAALSAAMEQLMSATEVDVQLVRGGSVQSRRYRLR